VWRLCDGERTASEIAVEAGLKHDAVKFALRTLEDAKLLDGTLASELRGTQSRRAFMRKAAIAGAVPAIVSISAPTAAMAATGDYCRLNGENPTPCSEGYTCSKSAGGGTCVPN
jgi:hypothetical protein